MSGQLNNTILHPRAISSRSHQLSAKADFSTQSSDRVDRRPLFARIGWALRCPLGLDTDSVVLDTRREPINPRDLGSESKPRPLPS